jgi:HAD superfamily hydrolase (TIGR01509 family)
MVLLVFFVLSIKTKYMNQTKSPLIAFIGLPNSGKSTLLNRMTGTRTAITAKEAHTTRDLNHGEDYWEGMYLRFVDTGGLVPDPEDKIQKEIQIKSWTAINEADILVWVIDRKQNPETISDKILGRVWKTGKPTLICINKVDDPNKDADVSDYARLGGFGFINVSAQNGYNLNILADLLVEQAENMGFEKTDPESEPVYEYTKTKRSRLKTVSRDEHGKYVIVRESDEKGPGMYESHLEETKVVNHIQNVVFDFNDVVFEKRLKVLFEHYQLEESGLTLHDLGLWFDDAVDQGFEVGSEEFFAVLQKDSKGLIGLDAFEVWHNSLGVMSNVVEFIHSLKQQGKHIYYLTNTGKATFEERKKTDIFEYFDGGIASFQTETKKPEYQIYSMLLEKYGLEANHTLYIDDKEINLEPARELGMWTVEYTHGITDLHEELRQIIEGRRERIERIPKIILLGKPNVGKSSLFNALTKQDLQIVTDIAGTTLSVNDYLLERKDRKTGKKKQYVLLDTTGIRKPGQRTFGAESFATYRTIEAAYQSDVICFLLDGSGSLSHQDQVVAGIAKEARKGMVMIINKADLLDDEDKTRFLRHVFAQFRFLKEVKYIWVSAKESQNLSSIWTMIDESLENRKKEIPREDIRKLFNYLMKKQPPKKLATKKKAVVYDLLYKHGNPPTFELLVKDKTTIHWSYMRFMENIIRKQFGFSGTAINVKLVEISRKNVHG